MLTCVCKALLRAGGVTEWLKRRNGPVSYGDSGPGTMFLPSEEAGSRPLNKCIFWNFEQISSHSRLHMWTGHCPKTAFTTFQSRNEMIMSRLLGERSISRAGLWFHCIVNRAQDKDPGQRIMMKIPKSSWPGILDFEPMDGLRGLAVPSEAMSTLDGSTGVLLPEQSGSFSVAHFMVPEAP